MQRSFRQRGLSKKWVCLTGKYLFAAQSGSAGYQPEEPCWGNPALAQACLLFSHKNLWRHFQKLKSKLIVTSLHFNMNVAHLSSCILIVLYSKMTQESHLKLSVCPALRGRRPWSHWCWCKWGANILKSVCGFSLADLLIFHALCSAMALMPEKIKSKLNSEKTHKSYFCRFCFWLQKQLQTQHKNN